LGYCKNGRKRIRTKKKKKEMAINVKLTRILLTAAYTLARHTFLTRGRTETRIQSWAPPQKREFPELPTQFYRQEKASHRPHTFSGKNHDTILQDRKS